MTGPDRTQGRPAPAHEDVPDLVTTDPGAQQEPGQGERVPEPDDEPGFA